MPEVRMFVETEIVPTVAFHPAVSADFETVQVPIPPIPNHDAELKFYKTVRESVREACGSTACEATIVLNTAGMVHNKGRVVYGGRIVCRADNCPLEGAGGAGDREPRVPSPDPSLLKAVAE